MREQDPNGWKPLGTHLLREVPPDIVFVRSRGEVVAADIQAFMTELSKLAERRGPLFLVNDLSGITRIAPDARQGSPQLQIESCLRGIVFLGASFSQQVTVKLMFQARKLFRAGAPTTPICFCTTEAEGYAWIEQVRSAPGPA